MLFVSGTHSLILDGDDDDDDGRRASLLYWGGRVHHVMEEVHGAITS